MLRKNEEVSTIFVVGFPYDLKEREFINMFTFCAGFQGACLKIANADGTVSYPAPNHSSTNLEQAPGDLRGKQSIGFARFQTRPDAIRACIHVTGKKVDSERGCILKAEMARKNLFISPEILAEALREREQREAFYRQLAEGNKENEFDFVNNDNKNNNNNNYETNKNNNLLLTPTSSVCKTPSYRQTRINNNNNNNNNNLRIQTSFSNGSAQQQQQQQQRAVDWSSPTLRGVKNRGAEHFSPLISVPLSPISPLKENPMSNNYPMSNNNNNNSNNNNNNKFSGNVGSFNANVYDWLSSTEQKPDFDSPRMRDNNNNNNNNSSSALLLNFGGRREETVNHKGLQNLPVLPPFKGFLHDFVHDSSLPNSQKDDEMNDRFSQMRLNV